MDYTPQWLRMSADIPSALSTLVQKVLWRVSRRAQGFINLVSVDYGTKGLLVVQPKKSWEWHGIVMPMVSATPSTKPEKVVLRSTVDPRLLSPGETELFRCKKWTF